MKAQRLVMNSEEMRKSRLSSGIPAIILFVVIVSAQTSLAISIGNTTSQNWTFTSSPGQPNADGVYGPFSPDDDGDFSNPGDPLLYVGERATWGNNAWALRNDEMDIYIPNFPDTSPRTWKEMQVTLTWLEGSADLVPDLPKEPVVFTSPQGQILDRQDESIPGSGWTSTTFTIRIEPNPPSEWVFIKGNIALLQVSVDTVCVPEPATLGLLIGGAFMAFKRNRNKYGKKQIKEIAGDMNL